MYLEPIFASDDIKKKMALEKQKFDAVDAFWRQTMENKEKNLYDRIDNEHLKMNFK